MNRAVLASVLRGRPVKNWLISYIHDSTLADFAARYAGGRVIDIGCGIKPYRAMLAPLVSEHVGVDHAGSFHDQSQVDLFGSAYQIPAPDASFDTALCTAVLEHLEEPEDALRECRRVLKPGACAIYSVPFIWHLHEEPRDFVRYSKYGLQHLFQKAGFEVVEMRPLSGFFTTFGTLLGYYLFRLNRGPVRWLRLVPLASLLLQVIAWGLDKLTRDERYTWMYMVVARKPAGLASLAA